MLGLLLACSLRDWVPYGPSLPSPDGWLAEAVEPAVWTGPAPAHPAVPFQLFGFRYERDIVLAPAGGPWQMHEYAYVLVDGQGIWVAKDSDWDGRQTVSVEVPDLATWLPEVPAPRTVSAVTVEDRSEGDRVDVSLAYRDPAGRLIEVDFAAHRSTRLEPKRNGSTFNHSEAVAAALLDVPHRQLSGVEATLRYDGVEQPLYRVLGLVPVKALLDQTQAGFTAASFRQEASADGFQITRPVPGEAWPVSGVEAWSFDGEEARYARGDTTFVYRYSDDGLLSASVESGDAELARVRFSAALPAGRPFEGEVLRHFTFEVNGELQGHGTARAAWIDGGTDLELRPVAPYWFAERPLDGRIERFGDGWQVHVDRVPAAP